MAQISALRQQDWATAYQDGSGQWMQLDEGASVYGAPATDESGAYTGSYGAAVDESGSYGGWVDVPAPAPAPLPAPAPEPAPVAVSAIAPAPAPVSYAVSYDEGGAAVYVPVYDAPTPAAPAYTVSYDEGGVSTYTPVYEAPAPAPASGWAQVVSSVVSQAVVGPTPAPAPPPPVAPAPAPVAAPAPAAIVLPSFEIQTTPPHNRTAEEWSQIGTTWNANSQADPYRLYQQMSEHGWSAADVAYATGQSVQAVGDYLTRIGAEAGFGGSATMGREVVDNAYLSALQSAQSQGTTPFTTVHTSVDESGQPLRDESGQAILVSQFDTAGFTAWYATQGTAEAQAFARIHGSGSADGAGGVQLGSGAHLVQGSDEAGNALPPVIDWAMDGRISAYQGFAKGNVLDQAGMAGVVQTPLNDQLIQTFGNPNATLPGNELGERMRALYGTELATYMLQVQGAADAMKSRYVSDLNAVLAQRPTTVGVSSPFWKAGAVHVDESGSYIHTDESGQPITVQDYEFDAAAFQQWYAQQGTAQQLITQAYGANVAEASTGGFKTAGTTDQLNLSLSFDESGVLSAQDVTLSQQELTTINIADPPDLYNSGAVSFMPMQGFVTSVNNIKPEEDWFDQLVPIIIVAVVSYFSAGTLGPAAAGAMGLAEGTLAATVVSAAVAGAVTSTVSGALNGNLSFKGILQGALTGALTAGITAGIGEVAGAQLASMGTAGRVLQSMTVQGAVRALMGGSFEEGLVAGLASGLSSVVCAQINGNVAQALNAGTMTAAEASAARYFSSMLGAAIKIAAGGAGAPGYALANAFLDETFAQLGGGVLQPAPTVTGTQGGTSTAAPTGEEPTMQGTPATGAATAETTTGGTTDASTGDTSTDDASSSGGTESTGAATEQPVDGTPTETSSSSTDSETPPSVDGATAAPVDVNAPAGDEVTDDDDEDDDTDSAATQIKPPSYVAQRGQGPLAIASNIDGDHAFAALAYMAGDGQIKYNASLNRWITSAGREYSADLSGLSDEQLAKLDQIGRRMVSVESGIDSQRTALAQAQQLALQQQQQASSGSFGGSFTPSLSDAQPGSFAALSAPQPSILGPAGPTTYDYVAFTGGTIRNLVVTAGAGISGLATLVGTWGDADAAAYVSQSIQEQYSWKPSTAGQQDIATSLVQSAPIQFFTDLKQSTGDYYAQYGPLAGTAGYMAPDVLLTLVAPYASRLAGAGMAATSDLVSTVRAVMTWDNATLGAMPDVVVNAGATTARVGGAMEATLGEAGTLVRAALPATEDAALSLTEGATPAQLTRAVTGAGAEADAAEQVLARTGTADAAADASGASTGSARTTGGTSPRPVDAEVPPVEDLPPVQDIPPAQPKPPVNSSVPPLSPTELDALRTAGLTDAEIARHIELSGDVNLFRGTSAGWEGSPGAQATAVSASTDPYVATIFALEARGQGGQAVLLFGPRSQIGAFDVGNWMAAQEREVGVLMSAEAFAERAPYSVSADVARQVLKDMGMPELPYSVASPSARSILLDSAPKMTPEQVAEFLRRVAGGG